MGWMVMYVAVFMLMATAMINFSTERRDNASETQAQAVAWQLAAWHRGAVFTCYDPAGTFCLAPGRLNDADVKAHLGMFAGERGAKYTFSVMRDGDAYDGKFVSLVDPENRTLVTYYRLTDLNKREAGPIVSGLTHGQGWTAIMGFYDASKNRVDRVGVLPDTDPAVIRTTIKPSIGGQSVPDGAPVIITRY